MKKWTLQIFTEALQHAIPEGTPRAQVSALNVVTETCLANVTPAFTDTSLPPPLLLAAIGAQFSYFGAEYSRICRTGATHAGGATG